MISSNVQQQLSKNKIKRLSGYGDEAVFEALSLINDAYCSDRDVLKRISGEGRQKAVFSRADLDATRLYSIEDIRKTCLQYRLRFLDSSKFKGEIPYEAILKVRDLERRLGVQLSDFAIMAPDSRFRLEDCDKDPLLFLKLSDTYYYLIHQWGGDLSWYRKMVMWPMRSFFTLGVTVAAVSVLLALAIPTELLLGEAAAHSAYARLALFFWFLVSITSGVTYVGFAFFKNVTANQWNSSFFKQ